MFKLENVGLGWNLLIYVVAVVGVWLSGVRLANLVDIISDRTGMGKAFAGFLLLSIATSFPEFVTCIATARIGKADMIGSNLAGGVCMQTAVLCVADWKYGKKALTGHAPTAPNLLSGTVVLLLLAIASLGFVSGDYAIAGRVGVLPIMMVIVMLIGMKMLYRYQGTESWTPDNPPQKTGNSRDKAGSISRYKLYGSFAFFTLCIGVAGTVVTYSSEAITNRWNIGAGFAGAVFIAVSTSLPELSACSQAVKMDRAPIAVGNIFGSNVFDMALLFVGDLFYTEGALFNNLTRVTGIYVALGTILTLVYLIGMLQRSEKSYLRLGIDSIVVIVLYVAGLAATYAIS